ncbi:MULTISPECIES: maleylpyruvate isomerase N-terminal domain-containing protein [Subtercola]|uniref:Mycothiol maleylpyruvate isomerase n=1 Tax=Subtercola vilae TaxID=2056433 RepID=A0A4T2C8L9_9MICO|nr:MULTISPECIES: maleylpyruvate isomerase N-terminal domain-containing protein [Subtercola]MEA9987192.1 maleylpyruvate isomerase N-terminal domain-containing protein [Subtercola sp. RTI3]TIH38728.1 mycothiol maleylpyruvate isomerase [Subtercola vilae]
MGTVANFHQAADAFVHLVGLIGDDQWQLPALGTWNVRSLVGHTTRAILTVETYLGHDDPGRVGVPTAEDYYALIYRDFSDPDSVAARGVEAGNWLGEHPVEKISDALQKASASLAAAPLGRVVSVGGHGIELTQYLRTRIFELVVHSIDIGHAVGRPHGQTAECVADATALAARIGARTGSGEQILLALTGRAALPEHFSVV